MLPESYYEPDWVDQCDDPDCDHDEECSFCGEPMPHCDCYGDD